MSMTTSKRKETGRAALFGKGGFLGAAVIAGALAACAPTQPPGPEQVHANNPSVTYTYSTDEQLLLATQKAAGYCDQYETTVPKSGSITSNPDGTNSISFECVPVKAPGPAVAAAPAALPMTYTYRTTPELLRASQDAEATCMRVGKRSKATITTNADGTKTATFTCVP
jgi:hypothetical protein